MRKVDELTGISGQHYPSPNAVWRAPPSAHSGYVLEQHDICLKNKTATVNYKNSVSVWLFETKLEMFGMSSYLH